MLKLALELASSRLAYRARRVMRCGILMVLAAVLATIAFLFLLAGAYALLLPKVGQSNAAFILAGALAFASLLTGFWASRSVSRRKQATEGKTAPPATAAQKRVVPQHADTMSLLVAAFAAGMAAGRKW